MKTYTQEQIDQANQTDLVWFLQRRGERFEKSGKEYRWKEHDSVTINGNTWFQHSRGRGGYPVDFMMTFYEMSFKEAMLELYGEADWEEQSRHKSTTIVAKESTVTQPAKKMETKTAQKVLAETDSEVKNEVQTTLKFRLPDKNYDNQIMLKYLCDIRKIDPNILSHFLNLGEVYEDIYHNVVFTGKDELGLIRYAAIRSTGDKRVRKDVSGSNKDFSFGHRGSGTKLYVFEAAIDLLSYLSLYPEKWKEESYISLGGCSGKAMQQFFHKDCELEEVFLCLDSDKAGEAACKKLVSEIPDTMTVTRLYPSKKDWNDVLVNKDSFLDRDEYLDDIRTLRATANFVRTFSYEQIERKEILFLWAPYIPLGKITIIQGNPGEGKTFLTMKLIASATNRAPLPSGEVLEPMNVLYLNAEDGLGDTIKPRLIDCGADLSHVFGINEEDKPLTLDDRRLELAIKKHNIKVVIMDPLQAFIDANIDMSKPNGCRAVFHRLHKIAEKSGAAIILVGHLNKNNQANSLQRGLGSMDITAAARSILLVGRLRDKPEIRIMVHDKCNIAPKGLAQGFSLETEAGFQWTQPYDIDGDQLLSGNVSGENEAGSKVYRAISLIMNILSDGKARTIPEICEVARGQGISDRTIREAKNRIPDLIYEGVRGKQTVRLSLDSDSDGKTT